MLDGAVQIGGPGAKDSNGDGGLCVSTHAIALATFTKVSATQLKVRIDNRTCDDNASITALFHNITPSVMSYLPVSVEPIAGTVDLVWNGSYSQTSAANDGLGFRADGFGNFDATIYNGNSTSPNGGNKLDIRAGEIFDFTLGIQPGFDLCDFLTELSTPPPGDRNRNAVGRIQACGPDKENSADPASRTASCSP